MAKPIKLLWLVFALECVVTTLQPSRVGRTRECARIGWPPFRPEAQLLNDAANNAAPNAFWKASTTGHASTLFIRQPARIRGGEGSENVAYDREDFEAFRRSLQEEIGDEPDLDWEVSPGSQFVSTPGWEDPSPQVGGFNIYPR